VKLPQINYDVQRSSTPLNNTALQANSSISKIGLVSEVGKVVNSIAHQAVAHQANTARSNLKRRMSDWSKSNDGKPFYSADELRSQGVPDDIIGGRDTIPAYEVQPSLFEMEYKKAVEEESKSVYDSSYRDNFKSDAMDSFTVEHANRVVKASREQVTQQNAQILSDIEDLTLNRDYDIALSRIDELKLPKSDKEEILRNINSDKEFNSYIDMVNFRDSEGARDALKKLRSSDSTNLDEPKQYKAINMLENYLREESAGDKSRVDDLTFLLSRIEKNAISGGNIDIDNYRKVYQQALEAGVKPKHLVTVETAVKANLKANAVANMPASDQIAFLQSDKLKSFTTEAGISNSYMESLVKENISYMNRDAMGYYHSKNGNVPTIDFLEIGDIPGATGKALAERMAQWKVVKDRLGVTQGMLKSEEVDVLSDLLLEAKPEQITSFTAEVNMALGRDATILYDQLRAKRKELGSLTVVGQLSAIGQPGPALQVLRGHDYRKNNPEIIQSLQEDFLPAIHEKLNGVFSLSPRYQSSIKNAILDVYAVKALSEGLPVDVMDQDLLDSAIATVTGGLIEHGDNTIEPPYYGATQATMDNWINNLSPDYIEQEGGVYHYSPLQVVNKLRSEDFQLESYGNGEYVIQTGEGRYLANKEGTGKFVLKFDESAPVTSQSSDVFMTNEDRVDNLYQAYQLSDPELNKARRSYQSPLKTYLENN